MFEFSKRRSILSAPKDQGKKIQIVLDCFAWDCFLEPFFDVSDSFVLDSFVYAPFSFSLSFPFL